MTDENMQGPDAEGVDWGGAETPDWSVATAAVEAELSTATYPERSDNPHNHRFTISLAPDKPPFIVVRGQSAAEITAAFNELEAGGVYANLAAAWASLKTQGAIGAGLGPVSPAGPAMPPQGPPTGATPPPFGPNVSVPQAPGYQGPPQGYAANGAYAPQAPGTPPPGQWGGQPQGGGAQTKPRPAGWAMVDVPFNDKDRFKALRAQGTETANYLRGKVQWGGKGTYWLDPSVAAWIAQQGFPVTQ